MTEWWKHATFYQIFPLSFQDSNGDGYGDLPGIIQRIEHCAWLGVDAIWLSPVFQSPMKDAGYDISDFQKIDPRFGTIDDFDHLVSQIHKLGMKMIFDFTPNHTSDQHAWFTESRSSRNNDKAGWYCWHDNPNNNWLSRFGGSAWQWDETRKQYYYHAFLKEQPDLNWRNEKVREAMENVLRFWLDRGVDGIRCDAGAVLAEDDLLRDDPPDPAFDPTSSSSADKFLRVFTDDRPETMSYLEDLRAVIDEFPDRVMAGEVQGKLDRIAKFYGRDRPAFHLPMNYVLLDTEWSCQKMQADIDRYLNTLPPNAWPNWIIGGHDKKRIASRVGEAKARVAAMLCFSLKGTAFFYAGDELGLPGTEIPPDRIRDPFAKLVPKLNRDEERTPLPWNNTPNGGFTTGTPWLPLGKHDELNVASERSDPRSMLSLYRRLLKLRRTHPAFQGDYRPLRAQGDIFLFERRAGAHRLLVALNFSSQPSIASILESGRIILSTHLDREGEGQSAQLNLRPDEGVLLEFH